MKLTPLLTAACAASAILLTACDDKPAAGSSDSKATGGGAAAVSEKDALEGFKKAAMAIKAEADGMKTEGGGDPMAMMGKAKGMFNKILEMKGDGLPADLKAALTDAQAKMKGGVELLKELPDKAEDLQALVAKAATDPTVVQKLQKFGEDFGKLMQDADPAMKKLGEVAEKYGIKLKD